MWWRRRPTEGGGRLADALEGPHSSSWKRERRLRGESHGVTTRQGEALQCKGAMAAGKLPWAWQRQGGRGVCCLLWVHFLGSHNWKLGPHTCLQVQRPCQWDDKHGHPPRIYQLQPASPGGLSLAPKKEWENGRPPSHLLGQLRVLPGPPAPHPADDTCPLHASSGLRMRPPQHTALTHQPILSAHLQQKGSLVLPRVNHPALCN